MTADQLERFLQRHDLSNLAFAELIGVTLMAVHHWLKGERAVSLTVARLCNLFDWNPELMKEFGK